MDIKLHILNELSQTLLESVPQSPYKLTRRLPHIYKSLNNFMRQHSHLLPQQDFA